MRAMILFCALVAAPANNSIEKKKRFFMRQLFQNPILHRAGNMRKSFAFTLFIFAEIDLIRLQ
jgi:hypothetical protein